MRAISIALVTFAAAGCDHEDHEECEDTYQGYASVSPPDPIPSGTFGFVLLDVGQGDAAVVVAPSGCAALLDGGPSGAGTAVIKPSLAALGITSLDFAIASHYHADHIGGLDEVDVGTDAVSIGTLYDRGGSYTSATFDTYASHFGQRRTTVSAGDTWSLCGEVTFRVVASNANGTSTSNENALSVAVEISYGELDMLVGGDLTGASPNIESSIAPAVGEIEVYKVHHHGSATSSNATLVSALLPTVSVIPVGANNAFGHPDPDTVGRLQAAGSQIWQTENPANGSALGHIQITTSTGAAYTVTQGNATDTHEAKGAQTPPDTTAPSIPAGVTAVAASSSRIDVAWTASTDDTGVTGYTIYRDGLSLTTTSATSYADTGVGPGETHAYEVTARDAAGNTSAASAPASATTPASTCAVTITLLQYSKGKGELVVRATSSQPGATLTASADGSALGAMPFLQSKGYYELKVKRPQPACVSVAASCGGNQARCF